MGAQKALKQKGCGNHAVCILYTADEHTQSHCGEGLADEHKRKAIVERG